MLRSLSGQPRIVARTGEGLRARQAFSPPTQLNTIRGIGPSQFGDGTEASFTSSRAREQGDCFYNDGMSLRFELLPEGGNVSPEFFPKRPLPLGQDRHSFRVA